MSNKPFLIISQQALMIQGHDCERHISQRKHSRRQYVGHADDNKFQRPGELQVLQALGRLLPQVSPGSCDSFMPS